MRLAGATELGRTADSRHGTAVSRADPEPRILVFVDGSPHYRDYVQAADESARRRLKANGYRPMAITDVEKGLAELRARLAGQRGHR